MDLLQTLVGWIANNESLLSGIAALLAVAGVVVSPIVLMMRRRNAVVTTSQDQPNAASTVGV